jgi:hypothetical protein
MTRALLALLVGVGFAPLVFFIPPHFPWVIGSVLGGVYFARRFSRERFTLVSIDGPCARCGTAVRQEPRTTLKEPHTLYCASCGQELLLRLEIQAETNPSLHADGRDGIDPAGAAGG